MIQGFVNILGASLIRLLIVYPIVVGLNVLGGAVYAQMKHEFDKNILIVGIKKGCVAYVMIFGLAIVSILLVDFTIILGGMDMGLMEAVGVLILGANTYYIYEVFTKLMAYFKYDAKEEVE